MEERIIPIIDDEFIKNRPLSYSSLKAFKKSPKHYIKYLTEPRVEKDEFTIGNLVETMLLEKDKVATKFSVYEKPNLRTNAGKEEHATSIEQAKKDGITLVTQEQWDISEACVESLRSNPQVKPFLDNITAVQKKIYWTHRKSKLPQISIIDWEAVMDDQIFVIDLKTTKDADPDQFVKDMANYGYFLQGGGYLNAYKYKSFKFPTFVNIAVEKTYPFNSVVMVWDGKTQDIAMREYENLSMEFRRCLDNKLFTEGYEFRLINGLDYFSATIPNWYKAFKTNID